MAETHDPRPGEPRAYEHAPGDRAPGAPRGSRTGSVPTLGFDDPSLRPLPPDKLAYHIPHPDAHPERHEHSDVPIRPLAISLAAIALTMVGTFVFVYVLFVHYKGQQEALERKTTNVPAAKPVIVGPRLQGVPGFSDKHPRVDMDDLREANRNELTGYGKAAEDGFARVPVDRAIDLALERGIFKTAQPGPGGAGASSGGTGAEGRAGAGGAKGDTSAPPPRSPPREGAVR